ncbi:hypothetical protein ANTPLA_LOCUS3401 [Anthophora plagiata]
MNNSLLRSWSNGEIQVPQHANSPLLETDFVVSRRSLEILQRALVVEERRQATTKAEERSWQVVEWG